MVENENLKEDNTGQEKPLSGKSLPKGEETEPAADGQDAGPQPEGQDAEQFPRGSGTEKSEQGGPPDADRPHGKLQESVHLSGMYQNWFLDYASYVILERAVPEVDDGLKPVQRRILHAMKDLDDGRYNKVANIIGHTMKYHPHGDASIGDALVQLAHKDLLILHGSVQCRLKRWSQLVNLIDEHDGLVVC